MKIDITGVGNEFIVRESETGREIQGVKALALRLNAGGLCEALLYVNVGKLTLLDVPRGSDGVRDSVPVPEEEV